MGLIQGWAEGPRAKLACRKAVLRNFRPKWAYIVAGWRSPRATWRSFKPKWAYIRDRLRDPWAKRHISGLAGGVPGLNWHASSLDGGLSRLNRHISEQNEG